MTRYLLPAFLVALAAYRITLVDRGHFFWRDEYRYLSAAAMIDDLEAGRLSQAFARPFECLGRPAFVLLGIAPTLIQRQISTVVGVSPGTLSAFDISCCLQVLVSLGLTLCVYSLALTWTRSRGYGLLAAVVFSLLCFANVWIRHLVPYYTSLVFFLTGMAVICSCAERNTRSRGFALLAGALTLVGFAMYPAYYLFVILNLVVLVASSTNRWRDFSGYILGAFSVVGVLEGIARLGNVSYVQEIIATFTEHAGQKDQGYSPEGFVFAWRYLYDVEGVVGVILLALFVVGAALILTRPASGAPQSLRATVAATMGCYLLHATGSAVFHKTIFFGRFFGMYLPFMVCVAVYVLGRLNDGILRKSMTTLFLGTSVVSFTLFAVPYSRLAYPADLLTQAIQREAQLVKFTPDIIWTLPEAGQHELAAPPPSFTLVVDSHPEGPESPTIPAVSHEAAQEAGSPWIGVNLSWVFRYRERWTRFAAPPGYELVAEAAHPTAFPAIAYEAYKPWERRRLGEQVEVMRIYKRMSGTGQEAAFALDGITVGRLHHGSGQN